MTTRHSILAFPCCSCAVAGAKTNRNPSIIPDIMKITSIQKLHRSTFAAMAFAVFAATAAHAQTLTILPGLSSASVTFDDTASLSPPPGLTNTTVSNPAWTGTPLTLGPITDGTTGDTGQGDILASGGFNTYSLGFANVNLTQAVGNTGFALLNFTFNLVYSITGGSVILPPQFPGFSVTGTVQPAGFAFVGGFIDYIGLNAAGVVGTLDTVNYGQTFNVPPGFTGTVPGIPVNGGILGGVGGLPAGSNLTLNGQINFIVDPASISATSFPAPEPGSAVLALAAGIPLLLRRRRS